MLGLFLKLTGKGQYIQRKNDDISVFHIDFLN